MPSRIAVCWFTTLGMLPGGCGGSVAVNGTAGATSLGVSGAESAASGSGGEAANANSSGGVAGSAAAGSSAGGSGDVNCKAIAWQAQRAADTSCASDSDCERPPHLAGDCSECGVVTNVVNEQSSLAAARSVCRAFFEMGCESSTHPCPAYRRACIQGVCAQ